MADIALLLLLLLTMVDPPLIPLPLSTAAAAATADAILTSVTLTRLRAVRVSPPKIRPKSKREFLGQHNPYPTQQTHTTLANLQFRMLCFRKIHKLGGTTAHVNVAAHRPFAVVLALSHVMRSHTLVFARPAHGGVTLT